MGAAERNGKLDFRVISIGTLSHNRLWGEGAPVRTAHATTTLVTDGDRTILVDPSLPAPILAARFHERTGLKPEAVTDVFCTTLRPAHRRGINALPNAKWWTSELELESYTEGLSKMLESSRRLEADDRHQLESDLKLLERFHPAPETFSSQVDLYPMAGASPGSAGLLLTDATSTIVIAGDAAITGEHLRRGQVWEGCFDAEAALRSLEDLLELADMVVCGHDNLTVLLGRWL